MGMLIKDLIHYEEIEDVIKIRNSGQEESVVSNYVISEKIKEHLLYMFNLLNSDTHKSFNIIGNYGTGKSHFLAFVAALLEKRYVRDLVTDSEVKDVVRTFEREFAVVKFECPATQEVTLRRIFYDNIIEQLEDKYDIEIDDIDLNIHYDNKKIIHKIIEQIKDNNPELGLLVIVDEISDFLKQKNKQNMTHDLNFLREIGEVSQETDFLYIGAMQEHVFTNPKYVSQAENIARISQRFVDITITKEDINQVISKRIVSKNSNQRIELEELLRDYQKCFTNMTLELDYYIDLFPIHPYVINVFEDLPYFENRGIINFASTNVRKMLDMEAPYFITYDLIYDLIDETHEIRNHEEVSEVISIVKSLIPKIDLLDDRLRDSAKKIIKALAVLKMLNKTHLSGATVQELANTLLITPPNKTFYDDEGTRDNIQRILANIVKITKGEFIDYDKQSDYYFINVNKKVDYDVLIDSKIEKQEKEDWEEAFNDILKKELDLSENNQFDKTDRYVFEDTTFWESRRSYRSGYLIIGKRGTGPLKFPIRDKDGTLRDYKVIFHSPFANHSIIQKEMDELIIGTPLDDDLLYKLKRISAAQSIYGDGGPNRQNFSKIAKEEARRFIDLYIAYLTKEGYVVYAGVRDNINELPVERYNHVSDILEHFKSYFFDSYFTDLYPKYPMFKRDITSNNILNEMTKSIASLDKMTSVFGLDENTQSYLTSFQALKDGKPTSDESEAMKLIIDQIRSNSQEGKYTEIDDIFFDLSKNPYGFQREIVYFLLATLLYNGEITFIRSGGSRVYASDFSNEFNKGLGIFESIRYLEEEKELPIGMLIRLFEAIGVQSGLIKNKNSRVDAVRMLNEKIISLKQDINQLSSNSNQYNEQNTPGLPWNEIMLMEKGALKLDTIIDKLSEVKKVTDLGKLNINSNDLEMIKNALNDLSQVKSLYGDMNVIKSGLEYQTNAKLILDILSEHISTEQLKDINDIEDDQRLIYSDFKKLLKEDQRRPLTGKFEQYKEKYKKVYYHAHESTVGNKVEWQSLDKLTRSNKYSSLSQLKNVKLFSPQEFNAIVFATRNIQDFKCINFNVDTLNQKSHCPDCSFPNNFSTTQSINVQIKEQISKVEMLWEKWEKHLYEELKKLEDKIEMLSKNDYKEVIILLIQSRTLPEILDQNLIPALNELTSEIKQVDFSVNQLSKKLLANSSVLTVSDFENIINQFKEELLQGHDISKVRIRVVNEEENNGG